MHRIIQFLTIITLTLGFGLLPATAMAAEFHSGQALDFLATDQLKNAYLAGSTITVSAPVAGDLAAAGSTVTVNGDIERGLLAAGGTLTINGAVGQTARLAGGTITINSHITDDLIILGGTITIAPTASIGGDLVVSGGEVAVNGPVSGKVIINGGRATINSAIGSLANSHLSEQLTLGPKAVVNGNLSYQSPRTAEMKSGSSVKGQIDYQKQATDTNWLSAGNLSTVSFFYSLLSSLVFCSVLLFLTHKMALQSVTLVKTKLWSTIGWGLGTIFLFPILAALLAVLSVWLGISGFALYLLCLMIAYYVAQILLGWWLLQWWLGRSQETYILDWRAVVVGVAATTILLLVPLIGWTIMAVMFLLAMGTLGQQVWSLRWRS
jgi:hypothetical protein